jgi:hypothetical protein
MLFKPGHGTVMEGIKELHKHMDREFRKLEERIDHLETAIKQMLLEITYLTVSLSFLINFNDFI